MKVWLSATGSIHITVLGKEILLHVEIQSPNNARHYAICLLALAYIE